MSRPTLTGRRACAGLVAAALAGGAAVSFGATAATAAEIPETFLSTASTVWSYSDDNSDPAAGAADRLIWTQPAYDDTAWKTATGAFGAKNGQPTGIGADFPITTLLDQYIEGTSTDVPTFHFRTTIDIDAEQLAAIEGLKAEVVYDDALQVFVNGEKVAGFIDDAVEAAPESERNLMYAGNSNGDPVTSTFTIDPEDLVAGENTIAVALHQDRATSSDIYFDFASLTPILPGEAGDAAYTDVVLTIGADASARNVTWYTDTDSAQVLQYAVGSDTTAFPASGVRTVEAAGDVTTSGEYNRRAAITGLTENASYVYRVGSEADGWSEVRTFSTASFSGDYDFLFFGDPQIGASGNAQNDGAGWAQTLDIATETYPDSELLFSAGDQVESAGNETHYEQFLAPEQLGEIALVPVNGNHDVGSKAYEQHYTVPNLDPTAGAATSGSSSGGDYWFEYKDVLYVVLNSNSSDYASHIAFMEKVVAEHGADATWKVLAFHHSIYSVASHVYDTQIENLRAALPQTISDLGFDLVLQGHDHSYTRSFLIEDGELADATEVAGQSEVSAGEGEVLYVTANSASGSKYYNVKAPDAWYASVINQEKVRNYSHIEVTDDAITVTTLRSEAYGENSPVNSVVDEVTLVRDDVTAPEITLPDSNEVEQGTAFDPLDGVTATDDRDGDLTASIEVTGSVDVDALGAYELVYTVSDAAGNETSITRTVTVVPASVTPPAEQASVSVSGDLVQGGSIEIAGAGFTAGDAVNITVHSDPVDLGTFTVADDGTLTASWTIPADFAAGAHSIVVTLADGSTVTAEFTVTAAAGAGGASAEGDLATTGAELPLAIGGLALALLVTGGVLVARRRSLAARD
ncbi:immunoglobulin-like domain-containing protein [Microbacterium sp. CIAB417]|uniref:immunoglobulin-like domain-containing protein n=1 Tax=Microbacterium sp. CIAB417 TaxID=2860287 RepID=UPI001FACD2BF|nr:immunoglobulin-like domain-containing protein [Microbacterium sp. CIAB417]